jgi:predicted MPP superfamily phosphohydrolase
MAITRRTLLKTLVAGSVGAATGVGVYGSYERDAIGLTQVEVPVAGLPPGLAGLRIGLITDVHHSRWVSADDVTAAVTLLLSAAPDLIVLGGDYVTWGDPAFVGPAAEALSPLSAPHGVFGILGNHDSDQDMAAALSAKGVQMLKDARTKLTINGESLELAGLRYWTQRQMDIASVLRGAKGTIVLLAHDPRRLREAVAFNVPLVLSGHTHGGQVVLR